MCEWFWLDCIVQSWLQYYCGRLPYGGRAGQLPSQEKSKSKQFLKPFKLRHCESFVDCKTIYVIALFCVCVNRPMVTLNHDSLSPFSSLPTLALLACTQYSNLHHLVLGFGDPSFYFYSVRCRLCRVWHLVSRHFRLCWETQCRSQKSVRLGLQISIIKKVSISVSKVLVSVSRTFSAVGPSLSKKCVH